MSYTTRASVVTSYRERAVCYLYDTQPDSKWVTNMLKGVTLFTVGRTTLHAEG